VYIFVDEGWYTIAMTIDPTEINIFFIVTTASVAILAIGWLLITIYVMSIVHDVKHLSRTLRKSADMLSGGFKKESAAFVKAVGSLLYTFTTEKVRNGLRVKETKKKAATKKTSKK
jgi:hypothetical protein